MFKGSTFYLGLSLEKSEKVPLNTKICEILVKRINLEVITIKIQRRVNQIL